MATQIGHTNSATSTGSNLAPGIYWIVAALITLIFVSRIRETSREPLRET